MKISRRTALTAASLGALDAAGIPTQSRSHFLTQDRIDRGVADGEKPLHGGWLARHMLARALTLPPLAVVGTQPSVPVSLQGYPGTMAVPDITLFNVLGGD